LLEKSFCRRSSIRCLTDIRVADVLHHWPLRSQFQISPAITGSLRRIGPGGTLIEFTNSRRGRQFGAEVNAASPGHVVLSAGYYERVLLERNRSCARSRARFPRSLRKVDAIITPTSPIPPFQIVANVPQPVEMYPLIYIHVTGSSRGVPGI